MHAHKTSLPRHSVIDVDPEDPSQPLNDNGDADEQPEADVDKEDDEDADTGELYGVHTSAAADRDLGAPEDRDSFAESGNGENWLEALEQKAAEGGPKPEREIVLIDDSDPQGGPPPTDFKDRPKADRGSGGRGGR